MAFGRAVEPLSKELRRMYGDKIPAHSLEAISPY